MRLRFVLLAVALGGILLGVRWLLHNASQESLFSAANRGNVATVRDLMRGGTDPNLRDRAGWTVLTHAAYHGQTEVARTLLDAGAEVDALADFERMHPYFKIDGGSDWPVIEVLIGRKGGLDASIQDRDTSSWTPLIMAAAKGHPEVVQLLIERKANVNARGNGNVTALHLAMEGKHNEVMEALLAAGADPNVQDSFGRTALHDAASAGSVTFVKLLLAAGANPELKNEIGLRPIDLAPEHGDPKVITLLKGHVAVKSAHRPPIRG